MNPSPSGAHTVSLMDLNISLFLPVFWKKIKYKLHIFIDLRGHEQDFTQNPGVDLTRGPWTTVYCCKTARVSCHLESFLISLSAL